MERKIDKPLVGYGYGKLGELFEEAMCELNIPIECFYDTKSRKVELEFLSPKIKDWIVAICITTEPFGDLKKHVASLGFPPENIVSAYDIFNAYPELGIQNGWSAQDDYTDEDYVNCSRVLEGFSSCKSDNHYSMFLDWRVYRREASKSRLFIHPSSYPLPSTLKDIKERRNLLHDWHHHRNFVEIHNEGFELEAVTKGLDDFRKYRPIISVACYHSRDGLWKIEKTLMDGLEDYSFSFQLKAFQGQAAYMYCIPGEMI